MTTHLKKLTASIQRCLDELMKDVEVKDGSSSFQEPDYVAQIAKKIPRYMAGSFVSKMNTAGVRWGLSFGGCFIHQKPKVSYATSEGNVVCELGDLMLLLKDGDKYSASLFQFKQSNKMIVKIRDKNDLNQLRIYTDWPELRFAYKNCGTKYSPDPRIVGNAAQYGFICPGMRRTYFVDRPREQMIAGGQSLAEYIVEFLQNKTGGWLAENDGESHDGWSNLIWDVVKRIETSKFKRANSKTYGKRLSGNIFCLLNSSKLDDRMCEIRTIGNCHPPYDVTSDDGFAVVVVEKNNDLLMSEPSFRVVSTNNLIGENPSPQEVSILANLIGEKVSLSESKLISAMFKPTKEL